jgi:Domain of unknown function (DUF5979)
VSKAGVDEPDPNALYTFTIECTIEDTDGTVLDVPLLSGESPVTLGGGETATFPVLVGSTCTVAETDVPSGAQVTIAEAGGTADATRTDGIITVDSDATVAVTNTFEPSGVSPDTEVLPRTR